MKITIFGATGDTGLELIKQGLQRGYTISTIVRCELDIKSPKISSINGSIFNEALVRETIQNSDIVISVLAFTPKIFGEKSTSLYSRAALTFVEAMKAMNVKKLVFCTSAGVVDDPNGLWLYKHILKPFLLKKGYDDMAEAENIISNSSLDWILLRPSRLTNDKLTKEFRVSEKFRPEGGTSISRADVAFFILNQIENDSWVRKTPTLAY